MSNRDDSRPPSWSGPSRHLRAQMRPDPPGAAEERIRYRKAADQAVREREERFPVLNAANAAEAMAWQEKRIQELLAEARRGNPGRWFAPGESAVYRYRAGSTTAPGPLRTRSGNSVRIRGIVEGHLDTPGFRRPYYEVEFPDGQVVVAAANELRRSNPGRLRKRYAYHVTARSNLPSIMKEGLLPQEHEWLDEPGVFFEDSEEGADAYSEEPRTAMLRWDGGPGFTPTYYSEDLLEYVWDGPVAAGRLEIRHPSGEWSPLLSTGVRDNPPAGLDVWADFRDYSRGDHYGSIFAHLGNRRLGYLDFAGNEDEVLIQMVEVAEDARRQGVAKALLAELRKQFPKAKIRGGLAVSDAGAALAKRIPNPAPRRLEHVNITRPEGRGF